MSDNNDDDEQTRPDMTRIEDLSEFLHSEDPETDAQLDIPPTPDEDESEEEDSFEAMSVDDLEDAPPSFADDNDQESETDDPPAIDLTSEDDSEVSSFSTDSEFSSESTQPDIEVPAEFNSDSSESFSSDDSDTFGSDDDDTFDSSETSTFESDDSDSFSLETDDDEDIDEPSLDEVEEIEEEAQLLEEVDQEIQEAMDDESEDDAFAPAEDLDNEEPLSFDSEEESEGELTEESEENVEDETDNTETLVSSSLNDIVSSEPEPTVEFDQPSPSQAPRESFKDINDFGNAITYGQITAGGNPPFSIILRKIKYLEDSQRIIEILREHGLCDESNESDYQQGLSNGSMLISQLSEYSAIYMAHKFRRFDLEILVGLADEIHPSKNYDMDYKGLVRKENLRQNKNENFSLEDQMVEVESILLATTPTLESYRIDRYLGVISTHVMIEETEFQKLQEADALNKEVDPDELLRELSEEDATSTSSIEIGLEEIYQNLAEALKVKAFKLRGNAVVGINYQITPLINQKAGEQSPSVRYKISCTGNAVWVGGKEAPRSEA